MWFASRQLLLQGRLPLTSFKFFEAAQFTAPSRISLLLSKKGPDPLNVQELIAMFVVTAVLA